MHSKLLQDFPRDLASLERAQVLCFMQSKATNSVIPLVPMGANLQSASLLTISGIANSGQKETAPPSLLTPGQLLLSGQSAVSSALSSQIAHKDVEVVQPNGAPHQARYNNYSGRERGRGSGSSRPAMKFNEEFDFMAMNEKFNKDEVWGYLGKGNKSSSKETEGDENASEGDRANAELPKLDVKDDFFDTLSGNATDNQSNNGRTKFSEQMKLDMERRDVVWFCS